MRQTKRVHDDSQHYGERMTDKELTADELASLRNWAESRVIDRSQKTRPLADVIAEARARAALLTDSAEAGSPKVRTPQ